MIGSSTNLFRMAVNSENIDDIVQEAEIVRNGTQNRMDEMRREISLLIAEYDSEKNSSDGSARDGGFEPLSNSVRLVKLKNI